MHRARLRTRFTSSHSRCFVSRSVLGSLLPEALGRPAAHPVGGELPIRSAADPTAHLRTTPRALPRADARDGHVSECGPSRQQSATPLDAVGGARTVNQRLAPYA